MRRSKWGWQERGKVVKQYGKRPCLTCERPLSTFNPGSTCAGCESVAKRKAEDARALSRLPR